MAKCTPQLLGFSSAVCLLGTIIIRWGLIEPLVRTEVSKRVLLEPGSKLWDSWTDMPFPIFIKFYFFNVSNPEQVSRGAKPILLEVGPYVYEEKRKKIILSYNDATIKYRPRTFYYFRQDLSFGSEDDNITMLNVPYVGIAKMAWDMSRSYFVLSTLSEMLTPRGEKLFHTHKVKDYLFDGVSIQNYMELLSMPIADVLTDEFKIPNSRFLSRTENEPLPTEDVWLVKTGKDDFSNYAQTITWNNQSGLDLWNDDKCDRIVGTDGTIFPPFTTKRSILKGFSPDFCRSVEFIYDKPSTYLGMQTMRFVYSPSLFGKLKDFPENECFCKTTWEYCQKGGVVSLAPCLGGAPVFASHPHFMGGHNDFSDAVIGLTPKEDFKSYIDVEMISGLPMRAVLRMQINIALEPYSAMSEFANAPKLLFPLFWAEETIIVTEELASPLIYLAHAMRALDYITGVLVFVSSIVILFVLVWEAVTNKWHLKLAK